MEDTQTAVADAPVSSSSTPAPAAPSSPSTSEPQSTTDRPSFGEALDTFNAIRVKDGKRPRGVKVDPSQPAPSPQDAATTQPEGQTDPTPPPAPAPQGPIPFAVHDQALKNARAKERQAVEQEFRSTYGDPQVAREAVQWFQSAARDRVGFLATVINEALADPELAPQIASLAGRTLGGNRAPQLGAAATEPPPSPVFTDDSGRQFVSLDAQKAREDWLVNRIKAEVLGEVQPDLEEVRSDRESRQEERKAAQLKQTMAGYRQQAEKWPYYKEHEPEIKAALMAAPLTSGHPAEEAWLLRQVYDRIVGPKLSQLEQNRVVADLKARANASSLNPAATGAPSGVPKNVRAKDGGSFGNALKWAAAQTAGR